MSTSSTRFSPLDALKLGAQQTQQRLHPSRVVHSKPQPPAALKDHQLKHKSFLAALAGVVVGALVCCAIGALAAAITVGTGGLGGVVIAGLVGAGAGYFLQGGISSAVSGFIDGCLPPDDGPIITHAQKTFIENTPAARVEDLVACVKHSTTPPVAIAQGSANVFIENKAAARKDDKSTCGAPIGEGASKTYIGGGQETYLEIAEEFNRWQRALLVAIEFIVPPSGGLLRGGFKALFKPRAVMGAMAGAFKTAPKRFMTKLSNVKNATKTGLQYVKNAKNLTKLDNLKAIKNAKGLKNKKDALKKVLCNDPIDPITGAVIDQAVDIQLGNTLPLTIKRTYTTGLPAHSMGPNWTNSLDQRLELEISATEITWHNGTGQEITFVLPLNCEESASQLNPGYVLRHQDRQYWSLEHTPSGITHYFTRIDNTAWLIREEDRHHNSINWERDDHGILQAIRHSDGIYLQIEHNEQQQVSRIIRGFESGDGHVLIEYGYNSNGYLVLANSLAKGVTEYSYNTQGLLAEWRDAAHTWARYEYDDQDRCIYTHCSEGFYQGWFEYKENLTLVTNSKGQVTEYHYNDLELITKIVNPLGDAIVYDYHQNGHISALTDPLGNKTVYAYDELGNVISVTDPMDNSTAYEYNEHGLVTKVIDALGHEWTHDYDPQGLLKRSHSPLEQSITYRYTRHGQLESAHDAQTDQQQQYHYDPQHRLEQITDALGHHQHYRYNELDQLTTLTDAAGISSHLAYDQSGRLHHYQNAQGHQTHYQYDVEGNLVKNTDAAGHDTLASYGAFDLLKSHTDANGHTYQYRYDPDSLQLLDVTNPQGDVYRYEYDAANNVIATIDYSGIKTEYGYNASGQCTEKTNALGQTTRYRHDANGNLLEKQSHEGESTYYQYDALNRLVAVDSPDSVHQFVYDAIGNLIEEVHNDETIFHEYEGNQQRQRRVLSPSVWTPDSQPYHTEYDYDANGQLTHLKLPNTAAYELAYDARGFNRNRIAPEGFQLHQQIDALGQLTEQRAGHHYQPSFGGNQAAPAVFTDHVKRTLQYDARQNPTAIHDRYWGDTQFNYDANAQISHAQHPTWQDSFQYGGIQQITAQHSTPINDDPVLSAVHSSIRQDQAKNDYGYQHGRVNERKKSEKESIAWIHDELGRVQEKIEKRDGFRDRTTRYTWNSDDQLVKVITPSRQTWLYQYDAFGRRITKYNPETKETIHTLWDGDVIAREVHLTGKETQKASTEYWHYQPDSFEPLAKQLEAKHAYKDELEYQTFYTVTDHIGSPRELFSADGNLAWRGYYNTWGGVHTEEVASQFSTDCNLRYAGQYFDKESGLHYNRFRYYDSESAQYLSSDPIGLQGGLKQQNYVDNPNTHSDPLGLMPWRWSDTGMGHHLVPRGKASSLGLDHLASKNLTPTFFPKPYEPGMHEALHRAARPHIGKIQGPWNGTADELMAAARKGLDDVSHIVGELRIPKTGQVLASNVTPTQAFDKLMEWSNDVIKNPSLFKSICPR